MPKNKEANVHAEILEWMRELYPKLKGEDKEKAERYFPELKERKQRPEQIYLVPDTESHDGMSIFWFEGPVCTGSVEYTRTDAFIKKACEWLKDNIYHRVYECSDRLGFPTAKFIDDFKNFMKGE